MLAVWNPVLYEKRVLRNAFYPLFIKVLSSLRCGNTLAYPTKLAGMTAKKCCYFSNITRFVI
jgi:hypothetical protein